jgi:hypothetical protein
MWSTECIRESARLNGPYANLFLVRTRFWHANPMTRNFSSCRPR